jgi:5-formyltetrahydrofolate cyclo-ligase
LFLRIELGSPEETKASIRKEMARLRDALGADIIWENSRGITRKLLDLAEFKASRNILFFLSLPCEVQTDEMIQTALDLGKKVHVPIVDAKRRRLNISEISGLDIEFVEKQFGIQEPDSADLKIVSPEILDFVLVPGLAFDRKGGRIGYGAGYFDKFLKEAPGHVVPIGVAFDFQVLDLVPQTQFDVPVRKILTEKKTIIC